MTSHDVVAQVRKRLSMRKVGHAGTLDPLATGVLVVFLGKATRLSNYLTGQAKRYSARILLGVETDTLDTDGTVLVTSKDIPEARETVDQVVSQFRGRISQTPPMYSARKVDGTRLHKLARAGKVVDREARQVEIHSLDILSFDTPNLDVDVSCSKGTYIRSLAADIGTALKCGGTIASLRRTRSGTIDESMCITLDDVSPDTVGQYLVDPNDALADMPEIILDAEQASMFAHGNTVPEKHALTTPSRVVDEQGNFWGLGQDDPAGLRPLCVLRERESREVHPA